MSEDSTQLVDLASERLGGEVLAANDEFFAPKENLLKVGKAVFIEDKFTDRGKWMDGWETRRRRTPGHDWCLIRLGLPGILRGIVVDTSFFRGNYPPHCSLEACAAAEDTDAESLLSSETQWVEVLPTSDLQGDTENRFRIDYPQRVSHLRFNIYPDGGVARLRVFGEVVPDWQRLAAAKELDLAAIEHGGLVVAASDMFFGSRQNLILPGRARNMGDGWETKRRRGPGHDWAVVKLGTAGTVQRVEVDTSHFKGNYPESCSLDACRVEGDAPAGLSAAPWQELLPRTKLEADTRLNFEEELKPLGPVTHVRLNIFPDGGVARLRVFGKLAEKK